MKQNRLIILQKSHENDIDKAFCLFKTIQGEVIKVTITGPCFVELRNTFQCDLETVCLLAAEYAINNGIKEGEVEIVGKTYWAVKNALKQKELS
jgi:predicted transcriptional regulator